MGLDLGSLTGLALNGASSASQIFSTSSSADEQSALYRYQAQLATNDAATANQNAAETEAAGRAAEQRTRLRGNQILGQQRAQAGASGFDLGSDTLADDFAGTAMENEVDALDVRNSFQRQANTYYRQAAAATNLATLDGELADSATASGSRSSGRSLLSSVGSVASSWYSLGGL
jgi:hypothetical protein